MQNTVLVNGGEQTFTQQTEIGPPVKQGNRSLCSDGLLLAGSAVLVYQELDTDRNRSG